MGLTNSCGRSQDYRAGSYKKLWEESELYGWVLQIIMGGVKIIGVGLTNSCGRSQDYRGGSYK